MTGTTIVKGRVERLPGSTAPGRDEERTLSLVCNYHWEPSHCGEGRLWILSLSPKQWAAGLHGEFPAIGVWAFAGHRPPKVSFKKGEMKSLSGSG